MVTDRYEGNWIYLKAPDGTAGNSCGSVVSGNNVTTNNANDRCNATRKSVLIYGINYAPEPTGVGKYTGEFGSYLENEGFEVEVVTAIPHYPGWVVHSGYRNCYMVEQFGRIRVARCPLFLRRQMRGIWRLMAPLSFALSSAPIALWRILTKRPEVVLCIEPTLFAAPIALLAAKITGARTILHVQDLEVDAAFGVRHLSGGLLKRLANALENIVLKSFDAVVTISNRMQEKIREKGIEPERLFLVRNWVDPEKIKEQDGACGYRAELGLSDKHFVALYAGNIGAKQALHLILEAAISCVSEPEIVFVIVGDGPEKSKLQEQYSCLTNVRFLPVQPEKRICELLNLANVHLLPQDRGAADLVLPSKLGGMLASGKPCIVMADPETELYEFLDGCAILLPSGDCAALAKAIKDVFHNNCFLPIERRQLVLSALDASKNLSELKTVLVKPD